jgi:signal peptidase I
MNTCRRLGLLGALAFVGAAYLLVPLRLGVVVGDSMSPSLESGSVYLFDKVGAAPDQVDKGDVVVFRHQGTTYVKRVLAAPGDTVHVFTIPGTGHDEFVMDWELEKLRQLARERKAFAGKIVSRRVPVGWYYMVGDHLHASVDSRELGPIPRSALMGRLLNPPPPQPMLAHLAVSYAAMGQRGFGLQRL